jgi:CDP-diacylglycerol--serine O-phosphatidyltransferase
MIALLCPADLISMLNAIFGFLAIILLIFPSQQHSVLIRGSFIFLLLAFLADGLDGVVARRTEKGCLGPYLESMADLSSTGIATAFFIFYRYASIITLDDVIVILGFVFIIMGYLFCVLLRLASFHPLQTTNHYYGLPAPAAALVLLSCAYLFIPQIAILILLMVVSLLMIAPIQYMKPTMPLNIITAMLIILVVIFDKIIDGLFIWILIILIGAYFVVGPVFEWRRKNRENWSKNV